MSSFRTHRHHLGEGRPGDMGQIDDDAQPLALVHHLAAKVAEVAVGQHLVGKSPGQLQLAQAEAVEETQGFEAAFEQARPLGAQEDGGLALLFGLQDIRRAPGPEAGLPPCFDLFQRLLHLAHGEAQRTPLPLPRNLVPRLYINVESDLLDLGGHSPLLHLLQIRTNGSVVVDHGHHRPAVQRLGIRHSPALIFFKTSASSRPL